MNRYCITFGLVFLLAGLFLFSGCTQTIPGIPFTTSQFITRSTDLNYTQFVNGDYNGLFLSFDGNVLTAVSVPTFDINSADINWGQLINFPSGCLDNQAVKIVGSSLVCVDLPIDTNIWTSGLLNDLNVWQGNFEADGNITGDYFFGDGSYLTGIQQGNLQLFFLDKNTTCS